MAGTLTSPVEDRRSSIDALRGVALFGVIVMNLSSFVIVPRIPQILATEPQVGMMGSFAALVVMAGKARSVFALLFGVGFAILLSRAQQSGPEFVTFYRRRLGLLLLIGVLNVMFLYWGDILILYAVVGFFLLGFRSASTPMLLTLGIVFSIVPSLLQGAALLLLGDAYPQQLPIPPADVAALMGDDLWAFIQTNVSGYTAAYLYDPDAKLIYILHILGMFLLGFWCVRKGMAEDIGPHRKMLRWAFWSGLALGLILSALFFLSYIMPESLSGSFKALVYTSYIGVPILAVSYASGLMLLFTSGGRLGNLLRGAFAPAGRMALTGYLGSNALAGFVLYGWGLGTLESWGMLNSHALGVGVFVLLAVFSALWLRFFRFGPAEWIWRSATYGRLQPLVKSQAPRPAAAT